MYKDVHERMKEEEQKKKIKYRLSQIQMNFFRVYYTLTSFDKLAQGFGNFLRLYHEALSALVQGYREVTMDARERFRFPDTGESIQ